MEGLWGRLDTWEGSNLIGCEAALQAFTISEQQQKKRQQKRKNKKQPQAGNVAKQFGCCCSTAVPSTPGVSMPACIGALSALHSGDAAGNDRQQQQFKDPIKLPTGSELSLAAASRATPVSQALARLRANQLSVAQLAARPSRPFAQFFPGLACLFNSTLPIGLPSLPCVLLLGNAVFNTGAEAQRRRWFDSGAWCSVREVWLNNVRARCAESGRLFHLQPAPPLRVGSNTVSACVAQRVVSAASRRQIPAIG
uniref:Uncharacterized protein n=1 Tax=Macrostomum lignano TaxID=282301 RepID=A0A1I8FNB3_9PLAT